MEHLRKADENEALAKKLDMSLPAAPDWAITMLFYAAVHYVEAYFSLSGRHYELHITRDSAIERDTKIKAIYDDYREMKTYSRTVRYYAVWFEADTVATVRPILDRIKTRITPLLS